MQPIVVILRFKDENTRAFEHVVSTSEADSYMPKIQNLNSFQGERIGWYTWFLPTSSCQFSILSTRSCPDTPLENATDTWQKENLYSGFHLASSYVSHLHIWLLYPTRSCREAIIFQWGWDRKAFNWFV